MRATATGLAAAAVLGLAASLAHANPPFYGPAPAADAGNSGFYTYNGYCWYGPNYYFRSPCLPPPFNGLLLIPQQYGKEGVAPAYASVPGVQPPPGAQLPPSMRPPGYLGFPGAGAPYPGQPPFAGAPGGPAFPTHPFVRSPRDFFMFGQTAND